MIKEDMLKRMFLNREDSDFKSLRTMANNLPKIDAIPVTYILDFVKDRDPVYKSNFASLIESYNQEVDSRDRIPEELCEQLRNFE